MAVPAGVVTLVFTDIEGSTRMWEEHPELMEVALARHDVLVRSVIESHRGYVFKTVGDGFCAAFSEAAGGVVAAVEAQRALGRERWPEPLEVRVRIGVHTGGCQERDGDYFGPTVNKVARIEAVAHGGQIVCSEEAAGLVVDVASSAASGLELRDLGEHRLKDLGRAQRLFQVLAPGLAREFPPLRSLSNPRLANNLPVLLTSFVGRGKELAEIGELLAASRVVTLTGPGGVGKSRLAIQTAAELLDGSGDGVWLVELAGLERRELVASAVAARVGVREQPGQALADTLVSGLAGRELLLVLDNCEHLIDECAALVAAIARACPKVSVLATSREPLAIPGERTYRVPSLSVPAGGEADVGELASCEAVKLFLERAVVHRPDFVLEESNAAAVGSLCRRLDGIPLAIELAAARLRSFTVQGIEARLDDRLRLLTGGERTALPRQRTLRALIDWSYDLLDEREQLTLCRLSVFPADFDIGAVEDVCSDAEIERWEIVEILASLVDKSLVQARPEGERMRYLLLESIQQYVAERLARIAPGQERELAVRHASFYLAWIKDAAPGLLSGDQHGTHDALETEYPNLSAALNHLLREPDDAESAVEMVLAMERFWTLERVSEGIAAVSAALRRSEELAPSAARVRLLVLAGNLSDRRGEIVLPVSSMPRRCARRGRSVTLPVRSRRAVASPWFSCRWATSPARSARPREPWMRRARLGTIDS
ncbi:MAG: ATP-binding protein [Solirubrobacteraceae bacterium]